MRKANGAAEPSMDEILASIRQIIEQNDGERTPARFARAAAPDTPVLRPAETAAWSEGEVSYALRPSFEGSVAHAIEPIDESWQGDAVAYAEDAPFAENPSGADGADFAESAWAGQGVPAPQALESLHAGDSRADEERGYERLPFDPADDFPMAFAANNDEPRMRDFREAVLQDAAFEAATGNDDPLISQESEAAISASFAELTEAIRAGELRSLEEMAQELLRPMMQEWLEQNLARTVQDVVREEIRRAVTRGR